MCDVPIFCKIVLSLLNAEKHTDKKRTKSVPEYDAQYCHTREDGWCLVPFYREN